MATLVPHRPVPQAALPGPGSADDRRPARERQAVVGLAIYAMALFVCPADMVLSVVGGAGFAAGLVALLLVVVWGFSALLGVRSAGTARHPTRVVVAALTITSLVCWALTPFHGLTTVQQLGADRWIVLVVAWSGVALVAAEGLNGVSALLAVLRWTVRGAAFCAFVAVVQWLFTVNLADLVRQAMPGFSPNGEFATYQARGALARVTGTALHPIELGVVAGMMLPIAIVVAMHDRTRSPLSRWLPVAVIALAVPASVSRAAVLATLLGGVLLVVSMPARARVTALVLFPVGAFLAVLVRPGYMTTLASFVGAGSDDSSVAARLVDYPMVQRMVAEKPWFGTGGGTFMFHNTFEILDNQYLKSAIELGVVGMIGLLAWFLGPILIGASARHRATDPVLRALAGGLTAASAAGAVSSATFDSLSFNQFAGLHALVVGCIGAAWVLSGRGNHTTTSASEPLSGS